MLQTIELKPWVLRLLGGPDGGTLFMMAAERRGPAAVADAARTGQVLTLAAPAPGAGWP